MSRWLENRLEKFLENYKRLFQLAENSRGDEQKILYNVLRRTRKRLKSIGILIRYSLNNQIEIIEQVDDNHHLDLNRDDLHVASIVDFIQTNNLIYGNVNGPSWAICLNTYSLSNEISLQLTQHIPKLISEYVSITTSEIERLLSVQSPTEDLLFCNVSTGVVDLWREFIAHKADRIIFPYCVRPDILCLSNNDFQIIELNVDTRLDRGITSGVTTYSRELLDTKKERFLADTLALAYSDGARYLQGAHSLKVVTVVNKEIRTEYFRQEEYFCKEINRLYGIDWTVRSINQLLCDSSSGYVVDLETKQLVNVIIPELEIQNSNGTPRLLEIGFLGKLLSFCPKTYMLGSILPFADKLVMAWITSNRISGSEVLKSAMTPTWIVGKDLVVNNSICLDEIKNCPMHQQHFVLKGTGIHLDSTGSQSVIICSDVNPEFWSRAVDKAINDVETFQKGWVLQPRLDPIKYNVRYKLTPNGRVRENDVIIRLSAFYTMDVFKSQHLADTYTYTLTNAVATAGTDRTLLRDGKYLTKASREATYMSVSTTGI